MLQYVQSPCSTSPPARTTPIARGTSCPGHILLFGHVNLFLSLLSKSLPIKGREARPAAKAGKAFFDGMLPLPEAGHSWKMHYFELAT